MKASRVKALRQVVKALGYGPPSFSQTPRNPSVQAPAIVVSSIPPVSPAKDPLRRASVLPSLTSVASATFSAASPLSRMDSMKLAPIMQSRMHVRSMSEGVESERGSHAEPQAPPMLAQPSAKVINEVVEKEKVGATLANAAADYNSSFPPTRFLKCLIMYLVPFPFLAMPRFRPSTLDIERDYVVSGAAIRFKFEQPGVSLWIATLALIGSISTIVLGTLTDYHIEDRTYITRATVTAPITVFFLGAVVSACYYCVIRKAHGLERALDRQSFSTIARFTSSVIDAQCSTCVYTWDEEGNMRVQNRHFVYRWIISSVLYSACLAFAPVVWREWYYGSENGYADYHHDKYSRLTAILSTVATFLGSAIVSFNVARVLDVQRQVVAQMRVLSKSAYLHDTSVVNPADYRPTFFALNAPVNLKLGKMDLAKMEGFGGWYLTRCFALFISPVSNHTQRIATMSVMGLFTVSIYLIVIVELIYSLAREYPQTRGFSVGDAHVLALVAVLGWGTVFLRFVHLGLLLQRSHRQHLYIADIARFHHQIDQGNHVAARSILLCRDIMERNDVRVTIMGIPVSVQLLVILVVMHVSTVAILLFDVIQWGVQ